MKRHLVSLSVMLMLAASVSLAATESTLVVKKLSGNDYSAALATVGRVYLTDGKVTLQTTDGKITVICALSGAQSVVFNKSAAAIPEIVRDKVSISVYPNPSAGMVSVSGLADGAEVRVFDLQGRSVLTTTAPSVDLSPLKAGIYLLQAGPEVVQIIKK